jgi:glucose-fructose oxidoreductase
MTYDANDRSPRREFLARIACGAATLYGPGCAGIAAHEQGRIENGEQPPVNPTLSSTNPKAATPAKTKLGVALLGLGHYASERLAPGLQLTRHCKLAGLVSGTPSKLAAWREQYDVKQTNVYTYDNLDAIRDNRDIDVVYVVTPTSLHAKFTIAAANAGKHVWCEKPMAMSVAECQSMIDACRQNGVKLSIGYRMQHEPNTQTIIQYARTKPYGSIQKVDVKAGYQGNGGTGWRFVKAMGGGALYDMGVYSINGLRYAAQQEPVRVRRAAQIVKRPDLYQEVDETTEFELEFPSGVVGYGWTSVGEEANELSVTCEHGSYSLSPMQSYTGVQGETSDGVKLNRTVEHQQAKQMDDDALAILQGHDVLVPGEEGLRDIRLVQAIIECARSGRPVTLA